jgi:hypothetical protein
MDSELLLVSLFTFSRGGVMSVSATSAFQKKKFWLLLIVILTAIILFRFPSVLAGTP